MPFVLVVIGAILLVVAYNNSQGGLGQALQQDVPPYLKWALAIAAVGALQWVPGLRTLARWMLGLVLVVIVLVNYKNLLGGVTSLTSQTTPQGTTSPTPAAAYIANPNSPQITQAEIVGSVQTVPGSINAASAIPIVSSPLGSFSPASFLAEYESGYGGFGGVA